MAHLRHRADGVNLPDERAVGLEEEEELEMQLVEPLTKLQLLEDRVRLIRGRQHRRNKTNAYIYLHTYKSI